MVLPTAPPVRQARRANTMARKILVLVTRAWPDLILYREAQFAINVRTIPVLPWAVQKIQIVAATQDSKEQTENNARRVCLVLTTKTMAQQNALPVRQEQQAIIIMQIVETRAKLVLKGSTVPNEAQTAQDAMSIPHQRMKV